MHIFALLFRDDRGATAIEYGLLAGLAVAAITAMQSVDTRVTSTFDDVASQL
jgi:pilus assembly protein Flp/PilA